MENQRMILDFAGQPPRNTDDPDVVATLTRKGWIARPEPPDYDAQTESLSWDGSQWVVAALPPPPVPESLPRHIAEEVLLSHSHPVHGTQWDAVLALVASLPADQRRIFEARLNAPSIRRASTTVASIAAGLGWSDDWIDDRFREGAVLEQTV
jgi:hypothetical protein